MKAQWTIQGNLQWGRELKLVPAGPRVSPCEDQVTAFQLSHGNWPHAAMVLQLRGSFTRGREALGNSRMSVTQKDGYLFESDNFTDGFLTHSETRHGVTCLHNLLFGLSWLIPWAQGLLGTARSWITGSVWSFCSSWPGRRTSHVGTSLSQCFSVGYEDGTQLFVSLSQNPSFLFVGPECYLDSLTHARIILSKKFEIGQNSWQKKYHFFGLNFIYVLSFSLLSSHCHQYCKSSSPSFVRILWTAPRKTNECEWLKCSGNSIQGRQTVTFQDSYTTINER